MTKIEGSGSESGSISQRHGSPDPDPPHNVMDPQHWYLGSVAEPEYSMMSCLYFLKMRCFSSSESIRWGDIPAARHRSYRQYVQSFRFFRYTGHRPCSEQTNQWIFQVKFSEKFSSQKAKNCETIGA
jgi:hypothetical protein